MININVLEKKVSEKRSRVLQLNTANHRQRLSQANPGFLYPIQFFYKHFRLPQLQFGILPSTTKPPPPPPPPSHPSGCDKKYILSHTYQLHQFSQAQIFSGKSNGRSPPDSISVWGSFDQHNKYVPSSSPYQFQICLHTLSPSLTCCLVEASKTTNQDNVHGRNVKLIT